jgi:trehalose/maltose hydrolase-like predicted phosphorylase
VLPDQLVTRQYRLRLFRVVQRFNSGDKKLGVPFVGLSGESGVLIC